MAKLFQKRNNLIESYYKAKKLSNIYLIVSVCSFFLALLTIPTVILTPIFAIICLVFAAFSGHNRKQANVYRAGVEGEEATARIIKTLPEQYYGIQNLKITYDNKTSELDIVVVGPTGVFVIETKNISGSVNGNYHDTEWTKQKISKGNRIYISSFYSPIKQVGTHVYRFANHLRSNGIHVHVDSAVYFANPEATVEISGTSNKTAVFSAANYGDERLINFITDREKVINNVQIKRILNLLKCNY